MFKKARLRLTGFYLLIIMLISLFFSAVVYRITAGEINRNLERMELRFEEENFDFFPPPQMERFFQRLQPHFVEDLENAKKRIILNLFVLNGIIFAASAAAGYFLAGETLKPIEEALEEQKQFISDASHELRTPLTALKTSIEVALRDKKMTLKEAKETLKSNFEEMEKMRFLSNRLLDLGKYQNGKNGFEFKKLNLAKVAEKVWKKMAPLAKEKNITFQKNLKTVFVYADENSLLELTTILLDNAIKYSPSDKKIIIKTERQGKLALFSVKDFGQGIEKSKLPHIFNRFYRADDSRSKTKTDGFGLGLSIAKAIVEVHKGKIEVKSFFGKGSTFTVKLPIKHSS